MSEPVLVVAGEPSGDRAAAGVVSALGAVGADCFGMGGDASADAGSDLVAALQPAMGAFAVARRAGALARAFTRLTREARARRPRAAVLVDYTEFNLRLAPRLRAAGTRVLWYVAPQVWAWRPGRARAVARAVDRLAVILPFEEDLWRRAGADARYVGHPAMEVPLTPRAEARRALGLDASAAAVALLPGSRAHEVTRLHRPMLQAATRAGVRAVLLLASGLPRAVAQDAREAAARAGVPVREVDPARGALPWLPAFDAALCASGTASLEAALAGAPPVVTYRTDALTARVVGALLRTPHVGLPNVVLGRRAFPELLQEEASPGPMAEALGETLGPARAARAAACAEVVSRFAGARTPSRSVAGLVTEWL